LTQKFLPPPTYVRVVSAFRQRLFDRYVPLIDRAAAGSESNVDDAGVGGSWMTGRKGVASETGSEAVIKPETASFGK